MFSYLRLFFALSVVIILGAAVGLGLYYRESANNIITAQAEQSNLAVGKGIEKMLSKSCNNTDIIKDFYNLSPDEQPQGFKEYIPLADKIREMVKGMPNVEVNIFGPRGDRLFSINQTNAAPEISGYDDAKINPILAITSNKPISELEPAASFVNTSGQKVTGILVRTVMPLVINGRTGAVEMFFDVTDAANTLKKFQYYAAGFVAVLFITLYLLLFSISRRSERIIEKQHETNLELAAAKSTAESENEQKSQFLANISHELRTPLNAIIGFSEIIKDEVMGPFENEQYKNYIKDIHSSGVHLLSLINDILDYSKAEAGKLDLEYEDIDLTKLIISSLRFQEPRAAGADVNLLKEFLNERIVIRSDAKRLKQVLLNLLSNAVKFTKPGGSVKITAWLDVANKNMVNIEVRDSGIGIAPKDIAKALAPFGQVDSELSRKYEGTGLGLPLTKKFVELLGGHLRLESELGKGTTVTITMPVNNQPNSITPS